MQRPLPAIAFVVLVALAPPPLPAAEAGGERLPLTDGWTLQTSMQVQAGGAALSMPGFPTAGWYGVRVPNTVVGAMVESGVLSDPYFGMNLRKIPGTTYKIGERFTLIPTPSDSPFRSTWWYRTEFDLPATKAGRPLRLHFDGINYRASIWLNGTRIATAANVAGVFRRYAFDVTKIARVGGKNALAVEVDGPEPRDLAIMWVDWNPTPADKNMGLWGDVYLTDSGPLALKNPHVVSDLDLPSLGAARITVTTEVENATDRPVKGVVKGAVEGIRFSKAVSIPARQTRTVRFTAADTPALDVKNPRIWWPHRMGKPELYTLALEVEAAGAVSDRREVTFGVQEMTSELTDKGHRLFKVNGKPILVKGGGWASDMLLRPITTERALAELRYVKEMGLNTIRLEGKLETDEFYDLADREGVLLMPGWCCCDQWEMWDKWDAEDHRVAPLSLRDQILRMRNHPSVIAWFNGSDFPPPARVERAYLDVLEKLEWSKPVLSNATDTAGPISGPTGVKMRGPYDYVPPPYWLTDTEKGGAFGFATEMGPGGAVPPIESLQRMIPAEHLWPIDEYWKFHAGGDEFKDLNLFTDALEGRYGKATGVEDYARKAQALAYENHRAMFEAFGRNKYTATGVIQWMLNNAWPSMIWHLYDYYLRPGGSYFGTKKAGEPVHVQYSYDDRSVVVVNDLQQGFRRMKVKAEVFDLALKPRFEGEATVDVAADGVARALVIPEIADLTRTYFVRLWLSDEKGALLSRNFYWLSTKKDELDWKNTKWYYTPTTAHADLTALAALPPTTLHVTVARALGDPAASVVTVRNTGPALAFQVRLKMVDAATGEERLPVFWDDNYIELFPGEIRQLRVEHTTPSTAPMQIQVAAWNAPVVFE